MPSDGAHSVLSGTATDAFLGYVYQAEVALLELTRRRSESADPAWALTIEVFDDVAFQRGEEAPVEFLQAKGSLRNTRPVTDSSPDLWKTLRNWADLIRTGLADPQTASFTLWTTQAAPSGGIAALLGSSGRDPELAHTRLVAIARTSENAANQPAYQAFLSLSERERKALVAAIAVVAGSPAIGAIDEELRKLTWSAVTPDRFDAFARRFRDWWYGRVRQHLLKEDLGVIEVIEIDRALQELREQLAGEALPLDVALHDPRLDELEVEDRKFVHQLHLISLRDEALAVAIRDYKRAFLQRHLWLQDELLGLDRLARYEESLIDEWDHHRALDGSVEVDATETDKVAAGARLYVRVQDLNISIPDSGRDERFICRGSYHMLADEERVGWHPEFVARLRQLLALDEA